MTEIDYGGDDDGDGDGDADGGDGGDDDDDDDEERTLETGLYNQVRPFQVKFLALEHESRILGQWSNPVSGSRKSRYSSPWAKQHRV